MLFLPLALQDVPATAVEAEQAMERAAQIEGQWTAVNRFAAPAAMVLGPQPMSPVEAYAGQDAQTAYHWWVSNSYVSCDGKTAVNTGAWERKGRHGWFTTVWQRQADGSWKWIIDTGDVLAKPRPKPAAPRIVTAECPPDGKPWTTYQNILINRDDMATQGASADQSLSWRWYVRPNGEHGIDVWIVDDRKDTGPVISDRIGAPQ